MHPEPLLAIQALVPFGAEASSFDVRSATAKDIAALVDTVFRHRLLLIRDQSLGPEDFVGLTRKVGVPDTFPPHPDYADFPELVPVSNNESRGKVFAPFWHSDGLFADKTPLLTIFYAVETPEKGGDTLFVDTAAAYDDLPQQLKQNLLTSRAVQSTGTEHPLAIRHPVTKEHVVCVNLGATAQINGLEHEDARALMLELHDHLSRPEGIYRHRFRPGDLLIWDNIAVAHSATRPPPPAMPRLMWRTTLTAVELPHRLAGQASLG